MTSPVRTYPDVETELIRLIRTQNITEHIGREIPTNLRYRLPYVVVQRQGGADDRRSDFATVVVDVLTSKPDVAKTLSQRIRSYLTGSPLDLWPIDRVETNTALQEIPFGDSDVRRWTSTYQIVFRRTIAS